jgi:hypothetical protein
MFSIDSGHFLSDEYLKLKTDMPHQLVDNLTPIIVPSSTNNEGGHVLSEPSRQKNIGGSAQGQHSRAHSTNQTSSKVPKWLKFGKMMIIILLSFIQICF